LEHEESGSQQHARPIRQDPHSITSRRTEALSLPAILPLPPLGRN
jgi:hypothetical protein